MKQVVAVFVMLMSASLFAQKTIDKPAFNYSTAPGLMIDNIEIRDTCTVLDISYNGRSGTSFNIPKKTYICDVNSVSNKLYVEYCDGLKLGKWQKIPESGKYEYTLYFPKLEAGVKSIDLREEAGGWHIYDIQLSEIKGASLIPDNMQGVWYNRLGGHVQVCFYAKEAFYKGKRYTYGEVSINKKGNGFIQLKNNSGDVKLLVNRKKGKAKHTITDLYPWDSSWDDKMNVRSRTSTANISYPRAKEGEWSVGESDSEMIPLCASLKELVFWGITENEFPYEKIVMSKDSAVYSGCVKGYTKRYGELEISIYLSNVFSGGHDEITVKVDDNGAFSVKVPILYSHPVFIRSENYSGTIFLEPGKDVFHVIGASKPVFMGSLGKLNQDYSSTENLIDYDYKSVHNKILDMSSSEYIAYQENLKIADYKKLDQQVKNNKLSPKLKQIKHSEIKYFYDYNKLGYNRSYEGAYRKKNKIPRKQRKLDIEMPDLTDNDLTFINTALVDDPNALVSNAYSSFINSLKFLNGIFPRHFSSITYCDLAENLRKYNYPLSSAENMLVDSLLTIADASKVSTTFFTGPKTRAFHSKYRKYFAKAHKKVSDFEDVSTIEPFLIEQGAELSASDKQYIKEWDELMERPDIIRNQLVSIRYRQEISALQNKYKDLEDILRAKRVTSSRNANLKSKLGINAGFVTDVMASQDILREIVSEYSPVREQDLAPYTSEIQSAELKSYIKANNERMLAIVEANKAKGVSAQQEMPVVENDTLLFDAIMEKYKGKVVYVDFWATWCSPCRSGIKKIAPLKAEMADEDVVFVYISASTSPQGAYMNMIPDIKGEHYKCTDEQWDALSEQFKITGIPHYALVDKTGKIVKNNFRLHNNEAIKKLIKKYL